MTIGGPESAAGSGHGAASTGEIRMDARDLPGLTPRDHEVARGAVSAGLIPDTRAHQLLTALSGLRQRGEMVSLAWLMMSHQAVSPEQARKLLIDLDHATLICPNANCGARYNLRDFPAAVVYRCKKCGTPLGFRGLDGEGLDADGDEEEAKATAPAAGGSERGPRPDGGGGGGAKGSATASKKSSSASNRMLLPDVIEEQSSLLESDFDESTLLDTSRLQTLREVTRGVEPDADLRPDEAQDLPANQADQDADRPMSDRDHRPGGSDRGGPGISGTKSVAVIDNATDDIIAGRGSLVYALRITRGVKAEFDIVGHEISRALLADGDASLLHRTPAHIRLGYEGELRVERDAPTRSNEQRLLVRDRDVRRFVRMRLLQHIDESTNDDLEGLLQEAQIAGQMEHPGVPPVYDIGLDPQNRIYVLEQMVERRVTLATLLQQRRRFTEEQQAPATGTATGAQDNRHRSSRLSLPSTRFLFETLLRVADTLAFAHARGIQYRNLRPSNVVLGDYGEVHVVDWSRAHLRGRPEGNNAERLILSSRRMPGGRVMTLDGAQVADPAYLPPEMASGDLENIGFSTDVHMLGAIAYEIVAGFPPYTGADGWAILSSIRTGRPLPLQRVAAARHVPARVRRVIERALARDPGQRQPDAGVFRGELRTALEDSGLFGPSEFRPGLWQRLATFTRRLLFGDGVRDPFHT